MLWESAMLLREPVQQQEVSQWLRGMSPSSVVLHGAQSSRTTSSSPEMWHSSLGITHCHPSNTTRAWRPSLCPSLFLLISHSAALSPGLPGLLYFPALSFVQKFLISALVLECWLVERWLAVIINTLSDMSYTWAEQQDYCPIVSCAIAREQRKDEFTKHPWNLQNLSYVWNVFGSLSLVTTWQTMAMQTQYIEEWPSQ